MLHKNSMHAVFGVWIKYLEIDIYINKYVYIPTTNKEYLTDTRTLMRFPPVAG